MGKKVSLIFILFFLLSSTCYAASTEQLYSYYGIDRPVYGDPAVQDTIDTYNTASRFVSMYKNLLAAESIQHDNKEQIDSLEYRLKFTESKLDRGYGMSLAEIYQAEEDYTVAKQALKFYKDCSVSSDRIKLNIPENPPNLEEYNAAVSKRQEYLAEAEIGSLNNLSVPTESAALVRYNDTDYSSYAVENSSKVFALFNGTVSNVYEDPFFGRCIDFDCSNGVRYTCANLGNILVLPGQKVYQGQTIGFTKSTTAVFRLCLDGKYVDVNKLFSIDGDPK